MTLRIRRTLFYIFIAVFIVASGVIISYAQGWRLDTDGFGVKKVGAIYIRSFPAKTEIALDGMPVKNQSWFFQNGTLINDLFPKNYRVSLSYEGYATWTQTVAVSPSLVTEIKYAVLVPRTPATTTQGALTDFSLINGEFVTQNASRTLLWRGRPLSGNTVVGWTKDGRRIFTKAATSSNYFITNLEDGSVIETKKLLAKLKLAFNPKTDALKFDSEDPLRIILDTPKRISLIDASREQSTVLEKERHPTAIATSRFWIAWTFFDEETKTTTLVLYDKFLRTRRIKNGLLPDANAELAFLKEGRIALLQKNGDLSVYAIERDSLDKIASDVRSFFFNDEADMVATVHSTGIEVISLKAKEDYWRLLLPNVKEAERIAWYADAQHLFVHYREYTAFLDIRDEQFEHFPTVANTPNASYDKESNTLYFLKDGSIAALAFPK